MSEKRFQLNMRRNPSKILDNGKVISKYNAVVLLNKFYKEIQTIQNYEQLISNSYVGEEETLDGFVGKYVIWENELQKYKNKNEMIDNG